MGYDLAELLRQASCFKKERMVLLAVNKPAVLAPSAVLDATTSHGCKSNHQMPLTEASPWSPTLQFVHRLLASPAKAMSS